MGFGFRVSGFGGGGRGVGWVHRGSFVEGLGFWGFGFLEWYRRVWALGFKALGAFRFLGFGFVLGFVVWDLG